MKTELTNYTVEQICNGFVYNELEGKGLFGLAGVTCGQFASPHCSLGNAPINEVAVLAHQPAKRSILVEATALTLAKSCDRSHSKPSPAFICRLLRQVLAHPSEPQRRLLFPTPASHALPNQRYERKRQAPIRRSRNPHIG